MTTTYLGITAGPELDPQAIQNRWTHCLNACGEWPPGQGNPGITQIREFHDMNALREHTSYHQVLVIVSSNLITVTHLAMLMTEFGFSPQRQNQICICPSFRQNYRSLFVDDRAKLDPADATVPYAAV